MKNNLPQSERWAFFGTLSELVETHARLPSSLIITGKVDIPNFGQPCISGGFADVKQGHHKGCAVAIKTTRIQETDDLGEIRKVRGGDVAAVKKRADTAFQRFFREVVTWNSLSHPNVLRLIGVLDGFGDHLFATVSEWMVHGNIMEYIRENAINRLELVRAFRFQVWLFILLLILNVSYMAHRKALSISMTPALFTETSRVFVCWYRFVSRSFSYSLAGEYSRNKRCSSHGMSGRFWVHYQGA